MQNTVKTFFILVSVMVVLFIATPNKVKAQKGKTAKLPKELVLQMARDNEDIKSGLRKQRGNTVKFAAKNFTAKLIDLNNDSKPEWFIYGASSDFCGNRTCQSWIYRELVGKYELLLDDAATPLDTSTNGYKDLESRFGPWIPTIFTYDGKHYKKGYNFTLNQIIIPSNLNEVKKMILNESKKRLIRVKNTYLKNDNGSWYERDILDDPSYEDNWKEKMNRNYSEIKIEAFKVSNRGISFYYDTTLGFAMAILSEEASPEYFYSWAVLKPFLKPSSPISSLVK